MIPEMRFKAMYVVVAIVTAIAVAGCVTQPSPGMPPTAIPVTPVVPAIPSPDLPTTVPSPLSTFPVSSGTTAVSVPRPIAAYSTNATLGKVPLAVRFTDESSGSPLQWEWDFGDGEISHEQNPVHTYAIPGTYTITLRAANSGGSDIERKMYSITVNPAYQSPGASFSANPPSMAQPFTIQFLDRSTGPPTNWYWTFGDGGTSVEQNPLHSYSGLGTYTVTLEAGNDAGTSMTTGYVTLG
jgi:PKD repeat protein